MPKSTGRLFPKSFEGQAPREFGQGANIVKTRTFNLAVARDLEAIDIGGSCLWALTATSLGASIDIRVNDQLRDPITFQQGMFIRGIPFSRLYVSHAAQAGETITIFFAVEEEIKQIEIVNPCISFTEVGLTKATVYAASADAVMGAGGITAILGPVAERRECSITNLAGNLFTLRIGNNAVTATRGTPLAPGETIVLKTTAGLYAWNPGGADQNVCITTIED